MAKRSSKQEKRQAYSAIPGKPLPRNTEESADSLYHIVIAIVFGIFFCLSMGVLDYISQDKTPVTDTTETIEYSG